MTLTDAGRSYVEACKRIMEQVDDAERQLSGEYRSPKGDLAVTTPWGLGHTHLLPLAVEFLDAFPEIGLRLLLTDRVVDAVEEGIDVAVRIGILPESSMIATRIGSIRVVVCASPAYLRRGDVHKRPTNFRDHHCIAINSVASPTTWRFHKGKREFVIPVQSRLCVNTSEAAVIAAVAGAGLTRVMSYKMDAARRAGTLELVLEAFEVGAVAGPHRLFAAQASPTETPRLSRLDGAPPQSPSRIRQQLTVDGSQNADTKERTAPVPRSSARLIARPSMGLHTAFADFTQFYLTRG